ncbi:hypothetical protein ACQKP0_25225 [Heyndrickxia sp. NPDC080065]|uniref:hypothetical protein n=1 Tax=Heyndrickxia sp. NPDC080065 TaxID=3390568 RepID=UPI003CFFA45B
MRRNLKALIGAITGFAMAGGWFVIDILTPEPNIIEYSLMAVVNIAIGWKIGKSLGKSRDVSKNEVRIIGERTEAKLE